MPPDLDATIAQSARARGVRAAVDTSGAALRAALDVGVDLVKPSLTEMESYAGRALPDPADQEAEAMGLVQAGRAAIVAVALG